MPRPLLRAGIRRLALFTVPAFFIVGRVDSSVKAPRCNDK